MVVPLSCGKLQLRRELGVKSPAARGASALRVARLENTRAAVLFSCALRIGVPAQSPRAAQFERDLDRELTKLAKRTGRSKSDLAREALRKQLAIQRFRELRRRAMPYAEAAGYLTDEDVFRDVS